jgi:UDP-N-acetylmuramate: L-alanyl-gamma-D-glutamyl-meso-diaminopimelate ligase
LRVHFIGIGGTGMGALAGLLKRAGHDVRGSDLALYPPMSTQLSDAGVPVLLGYGADNLDWGPERVVVGNICGADHVEVQAAKARQIPLDSFPSLLAELLLPGRRALVVAGTHGKTTTTSICAWILRYAGRDPSFLIGGVPLNFGVGSHLGAGDAIVLEGDEYDTAFFDKGSKFLHYRPQRAILTSVEYDHADIFADLAAVQAAFRRFVALIPAGGDLIVHAGDPRAMEVTDAAACQVHTYRLLPEDADPAAGAATYVGRLLDRRGHRTDFEVFERGAPLGAFSTSQIGEHNVANLLAAIALARLEGLDVELIRDAIRRFRGVVRRQELLGLAAGVRVITDFAHHPTAVRVTVTAIRRRYRDNALHVCFEPRSASSRRAVFQEGYAESFQAASRVYIGPLFAPEKVPEADRLDPAALARTISAAGVEAAAYDSVDALTDAVLAAAGPGDVVLILTSGAFGGLGERLLRGFGDAVVFARESDLPAVHRICDAYSLPRIHPDDQTEVVVIRDPDGQIAGCVGLQVSGDQALLFNLAVAPERRGEGLGWMLADTVIRRARVLDARAIVLLTSGAADFFGSKLGFVSTAISAVDPVLRRSPNFLAADDAICMIYDLTSRRPRR